MLMGHADGLSDIGSSKDQLLADPVSELDADDDDGAEEILFTASFEELSANNLKYDTVIWLSISLLLVLAWGVGIFMLLYLPFRRYVLKKDISSRRLYVTRTELVYKVSRPSFVPFWGAVKIEQRIPLCLVIDIIIEQGWLQSIYGIHTLRVESVAHRKATAVDELQVQGVANPSLLRKVIITEASKNILDVGKGSKPTAFVGDGDSASRVGSLNEGSAAFKSPSKSWKVIDSPRYNSMNRRSMQTGEMLLNKLEEVSKSMKKIELLIEKSHALAEVYEGMKSFYKEENETVPVNIYGKSKVAAEQFIFEKCSSFAILRSSIIFGPQAISPVPKSLPIQWTDGVLNKGEQAEFFYDEFHCPIYVKDVVAIILNLTSRWITEGKQMQLVLNVGGPDRVSRVQMAEAVGRIRGYDTSLIKPISASSVDRGVSSPPDTSMDISKLVQTLDILPTSFQDGVKLTLETA